MVFQGQSACRFLFFLVLLCLSGHFPGPTPLIAAEGGTVPQILILDSYHQGEDWSDNEIHGILDTLTRAFPTMAPMIERLDAKRFPAPEQLAAEEQHLWQKYHGRQIDLVLALDNPAYDLLRQPGRKLFAGIPVVFAGVNGFRPEQISDLASFTGVAEVQDVTGTLQLAQQLFPATREVYFIRDHTSSGLAVQQDAETALASCAGNLNIRFSPPAPFEALAAELRSLGSTTVVLLLTYVTDTTGRTFTREESTRLISAATTAPVFAMHETRLGHGIVGGLLLEGHEHGAQAAAMALKLLQGEPVRAHPPMNSQSRAVFDYAHLQRFHLETAPLPAGSRIINRPFTLWEKHRAVLLPGTIVVGFLSALIFLLSLAIWRQKKAEQALARQTSLLQNIINSSADYIFVKDQALRTILCNTTFARAQGKRPEDLYGKTDIENGWAAELVRGNPEKGIRGYEADDQQALGGTEVHPPIEAGNVGGEIRFFDTIKLPLRDDQGQIIGIFGLSRDVTERERSVEMQRLHHELAVALGQSLNLQESLKTCLSIALRASEMDCGGVYLPDEKTGDLQLVLHHGLSDEFVSWATRFPRESEQGQRVYAGTPIYMHYPVLTSNPTITKEGVQAIAVLPIMHQGKAIACLNLASHTMDTVNPKIRPTLETIASLMGGFIARVLLYEHLRASEEKYRSLFQNITQGAFRQRADGTLVDANPAALEIFGMTLEEFLGRTSEAPDWDVAAQDGTPIPGPEHPSIVALATGKPVVDFILGVRNARTGTRVWLEVNATPEFQPGETRPFQVLVTLHDITRQKTAEQEKMKLLAQLAQAQRMESIGNLAGGVAHDFNNMIGVIIGRTENALQQLPSDHSLRHDLEEIMHSARHSAELTGQLLAFARRQAATPAVVDLNQSVQDSLKMIKRLIGENIQLSLEPAPDLWMMKIDPAQIDQILANLAANARDAFAGQGAIRLRTTNRTLTTAPNSLTRTFVPGDYICLSFSDNGCGMSESVLEHVFEPFFTTKDIGKGTGLGLATVFGIVTQNGGQIQVSSTVGQGTTFDLYFPRSHEPLVITSEASASARPPQDRPVSSQTRTILLVEDEPSLLEIAQLMLTRQGYTVLTASSPGKALQREQEQVGPIDLLMTDVILPEMNGRELHERIHARRPQMRTLFMSGYTNDVIARQGLIEDGVHFLQKPFNSKKLAETIARIFHPSDDSNPT